MCNDECDFKCVNKYKTKLELFDKFVIASVFIIVFISLAGIIYNSLQLANCVI